MVCIPFERKGAYEGIYYRHHRTRRLICGYCMLMCTLLVCSVIVLGVAMLVTYLVLRPHATHYEIVSAIVPVVTVAASSKSESALTYTSAINAEFVYGLQARNPNGKVTMEYAKFNVQTLYLDVDIGHSSVGGFRVDHHGANTVTVTTSASNVVVNSVVANALRSDISRHSVTVQVKIDTRARAQIGSYTFWMWLHASCDVSVTPPIAGIAGTFVRADCHNT